MNDVRDEALGAVLERVAIGVEVEPADRLHDVLRRGSRRRAARFTAVGAALAAFVGAVSWAGLTLPTDRTIPSDIGEWRSLGSLATDGWMARVPPSWRVQRFGPCHGVPVPVGAIVTNTDFEFRNRDGALAGCWDAYVWAGFPRDGVAFAIQPYPPWGIVHRHPVTAFPLTPASFTETSAVRGGPTESYVVIKLPGEFVPVAFVRRWVGVDASVSDVAALDRSLKSLSVRGAIRWTETDGAGTTLHDGARGYTVSYPSGWTVADENLTPWLMSPVEILSLGTFLLRVSARPDDGFRLFDAPVAPAALEDMTSNDAFISVQESGRVAGSSDDRPDHFGPLGCQNSIYGCHASEELPKAWRDASFRAWWIPFLDADRAFYLFVAIGKGASPELTRQTWEVADSLSFAPAGS